MNDLILTVSELTNAASLFLFLTLSELSEEPALGVGTLAVAFSQNEEKNVDLPFNAAAMLLDPPNKHRSDHSKTRNSFKNKHTPETKTQIKRYSILTFQHRY
jgi:hypothetical protein